jgi:hypothetical protein
VNQPWVITASGDVVPVPPDRWLFEPGAWSDVEGALGTPLPHDYKDLIEDGLACVFDDELVIASPFDANPNLNLVRVAAQSAWALAYLRARFPDDYAIALYPEPGGLLAWGADGGGAQYHWDTSDSDPDRWTVAVSGRPMFDPPVQHQSATLSGYLTGLAAGEIAAAALGDWPSRDARISRRPP